MPSTATTNLLSDQECIHGLDTAWCQICREAAGIRRTAEGDRYRSDCTVQAFVNITGASYEEGAAYLAAAGFRAGHGTPAARVAEAFAAAGYRMAQTGLDLEGALAASRSGRCFYVSAQTRTKGHAWAIVNGEAPGAWRSGFRYRVFEITA